MSVFRHRLGAFALGALACTTAHPARAQVETPTVAAEIAGVTVETRSPDSTTPNAAAVVTAERLFAAVNVVNVEDGLKYLPNLLARKRHIGDTQAPITTRTSGVGSSARSLVYADGVLLSALIGNNNSIASPRWGMVGPDEIARIEVLYGPFSAAYPGNSIGAVVNIVTRIPDRFEAGASVGAALQSFGQYGTRGDYGSGRVAGSIGDRIGRLSFRLSANHLDTKGQPLAYVTANRSAASSAAGTPVAGGFADVNRTGAPISVIGAGGFEHQVQDTVNLKLAYDLSSTWRAVYAAGLFHHRNRATGESYLRDGAGAPVYAGTVNLGGYAYSVPASAFANNVYRQDQDQWMQSLSLASHTGRTWDVSVIASLYDYARDLQRLPSAIGGQAGSIVSLGGTGWGTLDLKADWRPFGAEGPHRFSAGAHYDRFTLHNPRFTADDWVSGDKLATAALSQGKTETSALWLQDTWRLAPDLDLTLGARWEHWRAFDGLNYSASPALLVRQPERSAWKVSPKSTLAWRPDPAWILKASVGEAYRFPTVTELYQAVTTGVTLTSPDPNLRPERAWSGELSVERRIAAGSVRVSVFDERMKDALISQSAPLVPGSTALFNYVQNIDRVRSRGAELVVEQADVLLRGLQISASATYVDSIIVSDPAFPAAVGKRTPSIPRWRASAVATYRPDGRWAFSLGARYSERVWSTADNSDAIGHTWQGFDGYFVLDARASYRIDRNWTAAVGVDNLNNDKYFLFHPFPQRTVTAELKWAY